MDHIIDIDYTLNNLKKKNSSLVKELDKMNNEKYNLSYQINELKESHLDDILDKLFIYNSLITVLLLVVYYI